MYGETNLVRNHTHSRDPLTKEVAIRWMLALSKIGIVSWRCKQDLEDALGIPVDILTDDAIHPLLKDHILREARSL